MERPSSGCVGVGCAASGRISYLAEAAGTRDERQKGMVEVNEP